MWRPFAGLLPRTGSLEVSQVSPRTLGLGWHPLLPSPPLEQGEKETMRSQEVYESSTAVAPTINFVFVAKALLR